MGKCDNEPLRANRYLGSWYFTLPIIGGFVVAGVADVGVVTTGLEDGVGINKKKPPFDAEICSDICLRSYLLQQVNSFPRAKLSG